MDFGAKYSFLEDFNVYIWYPCITFEAITFISIVYTVKSPSYKVGRVVGLKMW